jgi:cellulose synthase (UDP-forming)
MLHFFYGLPRMVFLLAPLSYLFFQAHIINASAGAIAVYALPHLFHANITNSRMQGAHRHSFWAELYEATLAWYIFRPTLVALLNPKFGKFNVTAKGGLVEKEFFDWKISEPYLIMLALNVTGLFIGVIRLFWWNRFEVDTVVLNLLWTVYNLVILGATIAVATETKQVRSSHRVNCNQKAMLKLANGQVFSCRANDYSEGGLGLVMPAANMAALNSMARVSLFMGEREFVFPAKVVFARDTIVGVEFDNLSLQQQMDLVQCTLARADAWLDWDDNRVVDRPLAGMKEICYHSMKGYQHLWHDLKTGVQKSYQSREKEVSPERGLFDQQALKPDSVKEGFLRKKFSVLFRVGRRLLVRPVRS